MRALTALLIAYFSFYCLRCATSNLSPALRVILAVCAATTLAVSILVMSADLRSTHFEGYILLIALALIVQSLLTLVNILPRPHLRLA